MWFNFHWLVPPLYPSESMRCQLLLASQLLRIDEVVSQVSLPLPLLVTCLCATLLDYQANFIAFHYFPHLHIESLCVFVCANLNGFASMSFSSIRIYLRLFEILLSSSQWVSHVIGFSQLSICCEKWF